MDTPNTLASTAIIPLEVIAQRIFLIRGQKVLIDAHIAEIYRVPTKVLNQAVRRNLSRFPEDFMFQLTGEESASLGSQTVTLEKGRGRHSKYAALAFTEQGIAMLASVLTSEHAIEMNIRIVRAFVRLREILAANKDLALRLEQLEATLGQHASVINILANEINNLKALPPADSKRRIGFNSEGATPATS